MMMSLLFYNLKAEFESLNINATQINTMLKEGSLDLNKIDMPSFKYFLDNLNRLL